MNSSQNMSKIKSLYVEHLKLFWGGMFLEYCMEAEMFVDGDIGLTLIFWGLYFEDGVCKAPRDLRGLYQSSQYHVRETRVLPVSAAGTSGHNDVLVRFYKCRLQG